MALVLALLLLAGGVTPAAGAAPEPPHQFYGSVYVGGSLATPGTTITARINSVNYVTVVDSQHRYGYSPLFKVPGSTGTVTFLIGATPAVQSVAWQSGGINRNDGQPLNLSDTAIDLTITTTSLTAGQVGTSYTRTLAASGGTAPYTWSVSAGSLPTGLSLSTAGVISETPTVEGTYTFTVQVTDAVMATDTQALSITISATAPVGDEKLLGSGATGTATGGTSIVRLAKFTASGTGNINEIRVYSLVGGNVKVALYSDSAGAPGSLLGANDTGTGTACIAGQWNTISLPATHVDSGTAYWIGVADATGAGACYSSASPIPIYYQSITYSSYAFPSSAGTGYTTATWAYMAFAGWGGGVAPVAPVAPTRVSTALTFKWNAATGATKYQLQVNNGADFTGTDILNADVGNVLFREVTGLTAGTTYYWRVRAGNSAGWGDWSTNGSMLCN